MHHFQDQDAVIFVVSLTDYAETGESGNKPGDALRETLAVFKEIIADPMLQDATIVLFLNKARGNVLCFVDRMTSLLRMKFAHFETVAKIRTILDDI